MLQRTREPDRTGLGHGSPMVAAPVMVPIKGERPVGVMKCSTWKGAGGGGRTMDGSRLPPGPQWLGWAGQGRQEFLLFSSFELWAAALALEEPSLARDSAWGPRSVISTLIR